ncbi:hypothetical protein RESH_00272 [Rhodopirellula europaea SH398]|uniref:Uncharacterized protein n=1 Tax=Rhodopirellula europaea SH398 TaxID=1263868 RepID=M5SSA7_9BACT|nr:hypothetical protein RESH_00272 [Rhodopirellula europaea SH398]
MRSGNSQSRWSIEEHCASKLAVFREVQRRKSWIAAMKLGTP